MKINKDKRQQTEDRKENEQHCGFIGLIGRPNVGKSTLLNQLVGQKVSITAHKAQTTRNRILGIRTEQYTQIVFIDTPGIHRPEKLLNRKIVAYATETLRDTDLNLWIVEPLPESSLQKKELSFLHLEDQEILKLLSAKAKRTVLVLNKIDTIPQEQALISIKKLAELADFAEIVPVSALKSTNVEHLVETLKKYLPVHPFYFETHQVTDASERFLASEFVREELFLRLQQEIPYSVAVIVEQFEDDPKCIKIACTICVERDSQKGIIIGKKGEMLKTIGTAARKKIERLLGNKVHLALHVKILKQWSNNAHHLRSLGFN
ncbi:MAG: GTPase Era [SAR324 cluster bacterium]|jgi:GTP-binding protein Era|nr:GTPase Era [SAR324 cluster bacterium]|tara:strand:- start:377 stop:1336 length:960 start_codon:yes stop_codon:yes gene_type:complete